MPTIQTYQRKVGTDSAPNVRVQADNSVTQVGAGLFNAVGQLGQDIIKRQEIDDHNAVIESKADLDIWYGDYTSADKEDRKGVLIRQGKDALGTTDQFDKDYDDKINEIIKTKGLNGRQQALLRQYTMTQKSTYRGAISRHEAKQRDIYTEANAKTSIEVVKKNAILFPDDKDINNVAKDTIYKAHKLTSGHLGDDYVANEVAKEISDLRVKQVEYFLGKKQGFDGQKFFEKHKGEIDPTLHDDISANINKVIVPQKARAITDVLTQKYGVTGERAALAELKEKHGNDPDFPIYSRTLQSDYVDLRRFKKEEDDRVKKDIVLQATTAPTFERATEIVRNSPLSLGDQNTLLAQIKKRDGVVASGKATPEQKFWSSYEKRVDGLAKDLAALDEYHDRAQTDEDEMSERDQKRYNLISDRVNKYWAFSSGGGYKSGGAGIFTDNAKLGANPEQGSNSTKLQDTFGQQTNTNNANDTDMADSYDQTFRAIKAQHPDASDEEIYQYMTERINGGG